MTGRNPWDLVTPLDARALGAMAWAPPQLPLFPPQVGDNAGARQSPFDLDRARSAGLLSPMGVFDRGLPVSGLGMSLPVVGLDPPTADAFGSADPFNHAPPASGLGFNSGLT